MIDLVKKENINLGILETDFDIFSDIVNTFDDELLKKDCLNDLDDKIIPNYFKNKIVIALQVKGYLVGYTIFKFINKNNSSEVYIDKIYVIDDYKNKKMEELLIESVIYVSGEVGSRNVVVKTDDNNYLNNMYKSLGFYEIGIYEDGSVLSCNVNTTVQIKKLNDKFRDIDKDAINYRDLKLIKKIASGRSGTLYLTENNLILKMFKTTSFTYIKDREDALKSIKNANIEGIVKPKNLVYYDGVFVGYIMDYLPEGMPLYEASKTYTFEEKLEKLKRLEELVKNLHSNNIYVCDLSIDNIFVLKNGDIKIIDCDSFILKKNANNTGIYKKYKDPIYKFVSEKTDMYAFAVTALELLSGEKIPNDSSVGDVEKIYNKNKNKLPVSLKAYFETTFKTKERYYLSDSYENYINNIYDNEIIAYGLNDKSGNISVIILSIILFIIAVFGYLVFKFKING